jgi:hypothetical protein
MKRLAVVCLFTLIGVAHGEEPRPFDAIDEHGLKASAKDEASLASLAKYLAKPCKTEEEKARSIYRWVTDRIAYDAEGFFSGVYGDVSSVAVLKKRKTVCEGYANLYEDLAKRTGLEAAKVIGVAKGAGFASDKKSLDDNHAWNTVRIKGKWKLIESTWGAGSLGPDKEFKKKFNEYFFLPDPEQLIFSHYPRDKRWQLLKAPLTQKEFEKLPKVHRSYFELGFAAKEMRAMASEKTFRGLVKAVQPDGSDIVITKAPLELHLKEGEEITFELKSSKILELAAINGKDFHFAKADGDSYRVSVTPKKGELLVSVKLPDKGAGYWSVLNYVVE